MKKNIAQYSLITDGWYSSVERIDSSQYQIIDDGERWFSTRGRAKKALKVYLKNHLDNYKMAIKNIEQSIAL